MLTEKETKKYMKKYRKEVLKNLKKITKQIESEDRCPDSTESLGILISVNDNLKECINGLK
tara:strand:- start:4513 stop:4695 length:183 start_codon:yes stop_codon:yes gene_type:complete